MTVPRILQAGLPKSGNLWIHETIKTALKLAGKSTTPFAAQHAKLIRDAGIESNSRHFGHDVIDIEEAQYYARLSRSKQVQIDDLAAYINACSLVWTHSYVTPLSEAAYRKFDKVVYIVRDPRDAAVSMSHFTQTEDRKRDFKTTFSSSEEYLHKKFDSNIRRWMRHVAEHIELADSVDMHFIFYERFLSSFDQELRSLLNYLELELTEAQILELTKEVSFDEMKKHRPGHVREGGCYKWGTTLTSKHQKSAVTIAQPLLNALNYPLSEIQFDQLPSKPDGLTADENRLIRKQTHRKRSKIKAKVLASLRRLNPSR